MYVFCSTVFPNVASSGSRAESFSIILSFVRSIAACTSESIGSSKLDSPYCFEGRIHILVLEFLSVWRPFCAVEMVRKTTPERIAKQFAICEGNGIECRLLGCKISLSSAI